MTGRKRRKTQNGRNKRKAIRDTVLRWTDAIVPYIFVTGHFSKYSCCKRQLKEERKTNEKKNENKRKSEKKRKMKKMNIKSEQKSEQKRVNNHWLEL